MGGLAQSPSMPLSFWTPPVLQRPRYETLHYLFLYSWGLEFEIGCVSKSRHSFGRQSEAQRVFQVLI